MSAEVSEDRREFLKDSGKWIVLTGAATLAWDFVVEGAPQDAPNYVATDHWWGMIIDIEKCIGCGNCVRACKAENGVPMTDDAFRTWVERYTIFPDEPEKPIVESPNGGYDGFADLKMHGDAAKVFFVPKICNHCAHSPCVQVCPVGATFESPDGVVLVDQSRCLGCRYCVQACPYGCRYIDPRTETVDKCTLCYHRITKGLTTACCETCPTGARQLVDLKNPKDPVHEFMRTHKINVLKPQMATGSKAFYNGLDMAVR
ncbi:MAG: 4Fe-4S dicluster domain-containing protein [Acidobacteria bacterium]|nr:4Fe-4S dicluster domain-containing protein [Acidobacteriota bacterium]